jgi:hypothetical protein
MYDRWKAEPGRYSFAIAIPGANISTNGPPGRSCTWCGNGAAVGRLRDVRSS